MEVPDTHRLGWRAQCLDLLNIVRSSMEWVEDTGLRGYYCPVCEGERPRHEDDCELSAVLRIDLDLASPGYPERRSVT
jgi:hypothetical protein